MTVYWIVWISVILLAVLITKSDFALDPALTIQRRYHTSNARFFFILASLILIFIAGCRYEVGADFGAYYQYTNYLGFWDSLKKLDDPGIRLIYSVASWIYPTGQFCVFSVAAVTLGLELRVIYKNTDQIGLAIVLFTFMCWTACFNGVRQALATAVLFCGFTALRDKKFARFFLFVILAFLCHRSAIVMVLVYFLVHRKISIRNVIILIIASSIVLLSYDYVFQFTGLVLEEDVSATANYWSTEVNPLRVVARVVPAVFFLFQCKNKEKTPALSFYLNLLIVSAVISVVTMNSAALSRMNLYMAPFIIISIVELFKIVDSKYTKLLTIATVLLYGVMEWYECQGSSSLNNFQLEWLW